MKSRINHEALIITFIKSLVVMEQTQVSSYINYIVSDGLLIS